MATKKNATKTAKSAKAVKKAVKAPAKKAVPKKAVAAKPVKKPVKAAKPAPVAKKKAPVKAAPAKSVHAKGSSKAAAAKAVAVKTAPAKKTAPVKAPVKVVSKPAAKPAGKVLPKPLPAGKKVLPTLKKPDTKKVVVPEPPYVPPPPKPLVTLLEVKPLVKMKQVKKEPQKPVVIPKINATTSRKYEPDFTKSILDQPLPIMNGPSQRYSDADLQEFRELISKKLDAAKKELTYLHGLITRKDEMSGDETDNRYMTMEDGSLSMEREQLSQMASRQIDFIDKLEKALVRIENKTYGICRVTGKLIDKARLRAVPHATLSIEAKMGIAKNPNIQ